MERCKCGRLKLEELKQIEQEAMAEGDLFKLEMVRGQIADGGYCMCDEIVKEVA